MSISTFAELKTAIGNWMNRSADSAFVARVPEFVSLAEGRINTDLRLRGSEAFWTSTYSATDTTRLVALPTGFRELLSLEIKRAAENSTEYVEMQFLPPEGFSYWSTGAGVPRKYTIRDSIEIDRVVTDSYTLRMHYLKVWDIASDTTNWLLTNHPGIYLFASLVEATAYLPDERAAFWDTRYRQLVKEVNNQDNRTRNKAELDMREGSFHIGRYNALTDY